jgi:WD40 repeat protein
MQNSTRRLYAAMTLVMALSSPLIAQHRVLVGVGETLTAIDGETRTIDWQVAVSNGPLAIYTTSDGRFTIWTRRVTSVLTELIARDETSAALVRPSVATVSALISHPRELAIYTASNGCSNPPSCTVLLRVSAGGTDKFLSTFSGVFMIRGLALTLDGSRLFVLHNDGSIFVLNSATGAVSRVFTLGSQETGLYINGDGSRIVRIGSDERANSVLRLYDVATGALLATATGPPLSSLAGPMTTVYVNAISVTPDRAWLYVGWQSDATGPNQTRVYNFADLHHNATIPDLTAPIAFAADGSKGYAVASARGVAIIDSRQNVVQQIVATPAPPVLAVASAPLAPLVAVSADARRINVAIELLPHSPQANTYIVEAALQRGGPTLASMTIDAAATAAGADNVPPGAYYVRVRARNYIGTSPPSAEQEVIVR